MIVPMSSDLFLFPVYLLLLLHGTHMTLAKTRYINYNRMCTKYQNITTVRHFIYSTFDVNRIRGKILFDIVIREREN